MTIARTKQGTFHAARLAALLLAAAFGAGSARAEARRGPSAPGEPDLESAFASAKASVQEAVSLTHTCTVTDKEDKKELLSFAIGSGAGGLRWVRGDMAVSASTRFGYGLFIAILRIGPDEGKVTTVLAEAATDGGAGYLTLSSESADIVLSCARNRKEQERTCP